MLSNRKIARPGLVAGVSGIHKPRAQEQSPVVLKGEKTGIGQRQHGGSGPGTHALLVNGGLLQLDADLFDGGRVEVDTGEAVFQLTGVGLEKDAEEGE